MKRLTVQMMVAAAFVALAAGSASAQMLKAEIPFPFQVNGTRMAPGTYHVRLNGSANGQHFIFQNAETKAGALVTFNYAEPRKTWMARGTPVIRFECSGAQCAVRQMWAGFGSPAYDIRGPKLPRDGEMRVAEIRMSAVKAD